MRDAGVDLAGVSPVAGAQTAVSMIAVLPDGRNGRKSMVLAKNANDAWQEADARQVAETIAAAPPRFWSPITKRRRSWWNGQWKLRRAGDSRS